MNYLVLSLICRSSGALLEVESVKKAINNLLVLEQVDDRSIFWDEEGDLLFHPPIYKRDQAYWLSLLNAAIDKNNWEFKRSRL